MNKQSLVEVFVDPKNHFGLRTVFRCEHRFQPSAELCCKFFSSSLYLFKLSDPVCVCSREYIQSTCGASPIHTDRGRSGWASERLCGKSLSWPLTPPTDRQTDRERHGRGTGSSPPDYVKLKCAFLWDHHQRDWNILAEGFIYKTASLSVNRKSILRFSCCNQEN